MQILKRSKNEERPLLNGLAGQDVSRRKFLRFSGMAGAAALVVGSTTLPGCNNDDDDTEAVNLGSGDVGILNYAYALEQLEAAFYTQAMASPFSGMTAAETAFLTDIRDHEVAHREFFKIALGGNAIKALEVNFAAINFGSRDSVLNTAKTFEDLGVAAYNGAGKLLADANNLLIAGKIVSVEARHAALIRDLLSNGSFSDLTTLTAFGANNANGLDGALNPPDVLALASPYLKTKINGSNLPTS